MSRAGSSRHRLARRRERRLELGGHARRVEEARVVREHDARGALERRGGLRAAPSRSLGRPALSHSRRHDSRIHRPITFFRKRIVPKAPPSFVKLARATASPRSGASRSTPTSDHVPGGDVGPAGLERRPRDRARRVVGGRRHDPDRARAQLALQARAEHAERRPGRHELRHQLPRQREAREEVVGPARGCARRGAASSRRSCTRPWSSRRGRGGTRSGIISRRCARGGSPSRTWAWSWKSVLNCRNWIPVRSKISCSAPRAARARRRRRCGGRGTQIGSSSSRPASSRSP